MKCFSGARLKKQTKIIEETRYYTALALMRDGSLAAVKNAISSGFVDGGFDYQALSQKQKLNQTFKNDMTLAMMACDKDRLDVLRHLTRRKADLAAQDISGKTALHYAVSSINCGVRRIDADKIGIIEMLINAGIDINTPTSWGETPLMTCATIGNDTAAKVLIDKGAHKHISNDSGKTAAHLASEAANRGNGSLPFRRGDEDKQLSCKKIIQMLQ